MLPKAILPREQVRDFAEEMERKLARNDHKRGWLELPVEALMLKLCVEIEELRIALDYETIEEAMAEAVDVGNFAMMVWDRLRTSKNGDV